MQEEPVLINILNMLLLRENTCELPKAHKCQCLKHCGFHYHK